MDALPREQASIHYDRSSLQAFLSGLTHHPTGAHWSEQRVGRELEAATWFVIDLLRQDEGLSQKYPRALSDGVDGDFCRWLCSEGIGRFRLPSAASETIRGGIRLPTRASGQAVDRRSRHGESVLSCRAAYPVCSRGCCPGSSSMGKYMPSPIGRFGGSCSRVSRTPSGSLSALTTAIQSGRGISRTRSIRLAGGDSLTGSETGMVSTQPGTMFSRTRHRGRLRKR